MKQFAHILLVFFLAHTSNLFAQDFSISGIVLDEDANPVSFANVLLKSESETKGASTDNNGMFVINNLNAQSYVLTISFLGFETITKEIEVNTNFNLGTVILKESAESLSEIEVIAKKPTLKREVDRLIFNVANTALSEGNMMEVLRSTPGVLVLDNSIMVKNGEPTVYINDKKINLTSNELAQFLESSPANSVKSIEVITNPSAKYDAESGAVVNIVMSKNLITGYRGSLYTNYTQGIYPRYNAGTTNFYKNDKISFSINYNYTQTKERRKTNEIINFLDNNNSAEENWASRFRRTTNTKTHNASFNFDYFLSENSTLNLSSNVLWLPYFRYLTRGFTDVEDNLGNPIFNFNSKNTSVDNKYNLGFDLGFTQDFKDKSKLSLNLHSTLYDYKRDQKVESNYFNTNPDFSTAFNTYPNQDTKIYSGQIDYELPIGETAFLSIGVKASEINTGSNITRYDVEQGLEVLNADYTDAFNYDENIYAGYVSFEKNGERFSLSTGLRLEQTELEGVSLTNNEGNNQDYLELFPTLNLGYQISEGLKIYTNYKRSIDRPDFQNLNPFQFFLNDNTIITGNPKLQPTFVDHGTFGLSILDDTFVVEAYYKHMDAKIVELPIQDNINNVLVYTPTNIGTTIDYGFDFSVNFNPVKRWQVYLVTSFYNWKEEARFNSNLLEMDMWSNYSIFNNNVSFLKDRSLAVNFALVYNGKNLQGFQIVESALFTDLSVSKSVFKNKGKLSLHASDLFNDQDQSVTSHYLNQRNSRFMDLDNRYIKIGFSYKFGNTTLQVKDHYKETNERDRIKERD